MKTKTQYVQAEIWLRIETDSGARTRHNVFDALFFDIIFSSIYWRNNYGKAVAK